MKLSDEQSRALKLLADAGPLGLSEAILIAHGFKVDMVVAGLVRDGLATVVASTVKAGSRTVQVTRVRITDAGRRALEDDALCRS